MRQLLGSHGNLPVGLCTLQHAWSAWAIQRVAGSLRSMPWHPGACHAGVDSAPAAAWQGFLQPQSCTLVHPRPYASAVVDELPLFTERQRLCILGTGWAAARVAMDINPHLYDLTVRF